MNLARTHALASAPLSLNRNKRETEPVLSVHQYKIHFKGVIGSLIAVEDASAQQSGRSPGRVCPQPGQVALQVHLKIARESRGGRCIPHNLLQRVAQAALLQNAGALNYSLIISRSVIGSSWHITN